MAYLSDDLTDKELAKLEKKINAEYSKAQKELTKKAEEYFKSLEKKYDKQYKKLQDGLITQQEFDTWYKNAVGRGLRWEKLRDDMAERLTRTNEIASAYVNDKTPSIFSLNLNYENYEIEKGSGVSFSIYDESTVRRLIKDNPRLLPPSRVNYTKDKKWNAQKLNSELTSAILQGKSIDKLADAFQHVTNMNRVSAIRNARTSMTGAQNGGRMESYKNALNMGIEMQKQWIATHDGLTRKSHQDVDGETIDVNETFSNDCMYPGDPGGHPAEVYNCRCTMRAVIKGINDKKDNKANQTYYQYIEEKRRQNNVATTVPTKEVNPFSTSGIDSTHATAMAKILNEKCLDENVTKLYDKYKDDLEYLGTDGDKAYYTRVEQGVYMDIDAISKGNHWKDKYQTAFHEFSHMIDNISSEAPYNYTSNDWHDGEIFKSLQKDYDNLVANHVKGMYEGYIKDGTLPLSAFTYNLDRDVRRGIREELSNGASELSMLQKYWPMILEKEDKESMRAVYSSNVIDALKNEKLPMKTTSGASDILQAFTTDYGINYPLGVGHEAYYFKGDNKQHNASTEFMSHYMEGNAVGNKEYIDYLNRIFPNGMKSMSEMIKELAT